MNFPIYFEKYFGIFFIMQRFLIIFLFKYFNFFSLCKDFLKDFEVYFQNYLLI